MKKPPPQQRCQCSLRSNFTSKEPEFFRIIHPALLKDGKPGIPKKFVRKYGNSLSNYIFLKVPTGAIWRVELLKEGGKVWLQNGWQEFAEYYSIGYGHFLLFRFEGNSTFHVLIFDMTSSEIEYPSTNANHGEEPMNTDGLGRRSNSNNVSVEILDDFAAIHTTKEEDIIIIPSSDEEDFFTNGRSRSASIKEMTRDVSDENIDCTTPNQNKRVKGKLPFPQTPTERGRKRSPSKTEYKPRGKRGARMKSEKSETGVDLHPSNPKFGDGKGSGRYKRSRAEPVETLERAKTFKSRNPFFIITMRPSYVGRASIVNIPLNFVEKHFAKDNRTITLYVSGRRRWRVRYYRTNRDAKLCSGWGKFVIGNHLQVGDACLFELMKSSSGTWLKVVIFRIKEDSTSHLPPPK